MDGAIITQHYIKIASGKPDFLTAAVSEQRAALAAFADCPCRQRHKVSKLTWLIARGSQMAALAAFANCPCRQRHKVSKLTWLIARGNKR